MPDRVVISCLIDSSVKIEDMGIHLSGRGSRAEALASTSSASSDLAVAVASRWVSVRTLSPQMPIWPFIRPASRRDPPPAATPPSPDSEMVAVLKSIDGRLADLLGRPSAAPPEVVAAHVRGLSTMSVVPDGLPGSGSHPQFISSTILPQVAEVDIRVRSGEVEADIGSAAEALKNARRRK